MEKSSTSSNSANGIQLNHQYRDHLKSCRCCFKLIPSISEQNIMQESHRDVLESITGFGIMAAENLSSLLCMKCINWLSAQGNLSKKIAKLQNGYYEFMGCKVESNSESSQEEQVDDFNEYPSEQSMETASNFITISEVTSLAARESGSSSSSRYKFNCPIAGCNRSFRLNSTLTRHRKDPQAHQAIQDSTHRVKKKKRCATNRCKFCRDSFPKRSQLAEHTAVQHEGKHFHCPYPNCSSKFNWKRGVSKHLHNVHRLKDEEREQYRGNIQMY